jgi:SAM-dependent methyltransferase
MLTGTLAQPQLSQKLYLSGLKSIMKTDLSYNLAAIKDKFPGLSSILKGTEEILNSSELEQLIQNSQNEFTLESRGKDWAENAQGNGLLVRGEGVTDLLKLANPAGTLDFSNNFIIGDFLAGNGFINQVGNQKCSSEQSPHFLNSDISYFMYRDSIKNGLFAVWQNADELFWLKDNSLDAAIFAYGTHHINNRLQAVQEAVRVLKPGGRLVFHDFEVGSAVDQWFSNVVSIYATPHPYPHFTKEEMLYLAQTVGLRNIKIQYIDDPFIITAETEHEALQSLGKYAINLYGLKQLNGDTAKALRLLNKYFGIETRPTKTNSFEAKIIRNALVLSATK